MTIGEVAYAIIGALLGLVGLSIFTDVELRAAEREKERLRDEVATLKRELMERTLRDQAVRNIVATHLREMERRRSES